MASNKTYYVVYRPAGSSEYRGIDVLAPSKAAALDKALPKILSVEDELPEDVHVMSVTYSNGNYHRFTH